MFKLPRAVVAIALSTTAGSTAPAATGPTQPPTALAAQVDALFAQWDKPDSPGCAVGIIQDGQFVYRRGYGMANLELDVPLSSASVFYIASASKQFTAAAIALLVLDGRLSLDDLLRKYFPELPPSVYGVVTVRQLLHHTSGIRDYLELMDLSDKRVENVFSDRDVIELLARQKALNFKPGDKHLYSNSNYLLLGLIVQRVTGQSLRQYAHAEIFNPLGMHSTQFRDDISVIVKNRASSYVSKSEGGYSAYHTNFALVGDGGLLTSVDDLLLWDQNFYHDKLRGGRLPPLLLTTDPLNNGEKLDYAFGLSLGEYRGLKTVSHGGAFNNFVAELMRFPEQHFSATVLCNTYGPNPTRLTYQIAALYLGHEFARVTDDEAAAWRDGAVETVAESDLKDKLGTYRNPDTGTIWDITLREGKLMSAVQGLSFALEPLGITRFRAVNAPIKAAIEFQPATAGDWNFRVFIPDQKPASFQKQAEPMLTEAQLAEYAGRYCSDELDVCYKLSIKDGKLLVQAKRALEHTLVPIQKDEFREEGGGTFRFTRNRKGRLAGMRLDGQRALNLSFDRMESANHSGGVR